MDKVQKRSCAINFSHAQFSGFFLHVAIWRCWPWFSSAGHGSMLYVQI